MTLKERMRFSIAFWHSFRGLGGDPFGPGTIRRPWERGSDALSVALRRMEAAFEFFVKIEAPFWCFHDRDIAPEGATLAESNRNLDRLVAHAKALQKETGVRLLWGTANLFSNPRYMCGAATNPDAHVFAYAAAQVKKALEVTHELGGDGYTFWGGREGYETLLNTDLGREQEHLAAFLRMAVDHAKRIGFKGQFYIEPKPKEPMKHQYDFDVASGIAFLRTFGLEKHFKFNIETNHATLGSAGAASTSTPSCAGRRSTRRISSTPTSEGWTPTPSPTGSPGASFPTDTWTGLSPGATRATTPASAGASRRATRASPSWRGWCSRSSASRSPGAAARSTSRTSSTGT